MTAVWITLVVLLALMVSAISVFYFFLLIPFRRTPEAQWANETNELFQNLRDKHARLQRSLDLSREGKEIARIRDQHLANTFRAIPVEDLQRFPGIGPATARRLREAGYGDLYLLMNRRSFQHINGIGPGFEQDIKSAVQQLLLEVRSRFDKGIGTEAIRFRNETEQLQQEMRRKHQATIQEIQQLDDIFRRYQTIMQIAEGVTFQRYLRNQPYPGFTSDILNRQIAKEIEALTTPASVATTPTSVPPVPPVPTTPASASESVRSPSTIKVEAAPWYPDDPAKGPPTTPVASKPTDLFLESMKQAPPALPTKPAQTQVTSGATPPAAESATRWRRIEAACRFGLAIAKIDGRIAVSEKGTVSMFLKGECGTDQHLTSQIKSLIERTESQVPSVTNALAEVQSVFDRADYPRLVEFARLVAAATGSVNDREQAQLDTIAEKLGVASQPIPQPSPPVAPSPAPAPSAPAQSPTPLPPAEPTPNECRKTLEIAGDVTLNPDLIRRQYRLLQERYDPSRFASSGAEFVQVAEDKRQAVITAATILMRPFGVSLDLPEAPPAPTDLRHNPDLDDVFGM